MTDPLEHHWNFGLAVSEATTFWLCKLINYLVNFFNGSKYYLCFHYNKISKDFITV